MIFFLNFVLFILLRRIHYMGHTCLGRPIPTPTYASLPVHWRSWSPYQIFACLVCQAYLRNIKQ